MTYVFKCTKCNHEHELFLTRFIKDEEKIQTCPQCGGQSEKVITTDFNFTIRGFCYKNEAAVDKQSKMAEEAMSEPLTKDEMERLPEIAAEEEKRRGLEPGSILKNPNQKENIPIETSKDSNAMTGKINQLKEQKREQFKKQADEQRKKIDKFKSSKFNKPR